MMQKHCYYTPINVIVRRTRTAPAGRANRLECLFVGTAMLSSTLQEQQRLRFSFTFFKEERDWLAVELENEISENKQWGTLHC
ncbi:MAG TPA: hypothetical protein VH796_00485 [Nitrososphaeraceae archaeon]|jgi:hypothetical protein